MSSHTRERYNPIWRHCLYRQEWRHIGYWTIYLRRRHFRTLERIESNKPCYTKPNMISTSLCHIGYLSINQRRWHFRTLSASRITNLIIQPWSSVSPFSFPSILFFSYSVLWYKLKVSLKNRNDVYAKTVDLFSSAPLFMEWHVRIYNGTFKNFVW